MVHVLSAELVRPRVHARAEADAERPEQRIDRGEIRAAGAAHRALAREGVVVGHLADQPRVVPVRGDDEAEPARAHVGEQLVGLAGHVALLRVEQQQRAVPRRVEVVPRVGEHLWHAAMLFWWRWS